MRTAISECDSAGADLGFDTIPHAQRPPSRSRAVEPVRRRADTRRPGGDRPRAAVVRYDRQHVELSRSPHPMDRVARARVGFATLAAAAVLSAAAVCGLFGLAQLSTGGAAEPTSAVRVHEGESLSDVAARVAPGDPVRDTVRKIVELNGLRGAEVAPGRTLIVPATDR
ncbi:LysM peptidoglycan-binding domain-containing protein [Nocardia sp. BMG51109]|uniref:LysM peptidoglycan-binding domain-containing protein n=1 Tax=Nocardia sp. BMG51109 TaxID=1056816 RepID=UPI0004B6203D|nr:LysM peptidoglycan-binding domain-containing protein [Nocardia sp. BMG51109]